MLAPALRAQDLDIAIWQFDGQLARLVETRACVIVETYPADACVQLGLSAPGRGWSKRKQQDRRSKYKQIAAWARGRPITLDARLDSALKDGFGAGSGGEDPLTPWSVCFPC